MKDANNRILLGNRQILSKNSLKQNSSFEMDSLHSLLVMVHISLCLFPPSKCHQKGLPSVASSGEYLLSSRTNERLLVLATNSPIFLPFTCSSTSTIDIVLLAHQIITMFAMTLQSGTSDACTMSSSILCQGECRGLGSVPSFYCTWFCLFKPVRTFHCNINFPLLLNISTLVWC